VITVVNICHRVNKYFVQEKGIQLELTVPNTPEQNGHAERLNRTLVEKGRAMLLDSNFNKISGVKLYVLQHT